jgi:hypothetical protein
MSLRLDNQQNDYFGVGSAEAALGSSPNFTVLFWYRRETNDVDVEPVSISTISTPATLRQTATAIYLRYYGVDSSTVSQSLNTWYCLSVSRSTAAGDKISAYQYANSTGARTDILTATDTGMSGVNNTGLMLGDPAGYWSAARGSYRYLRYWSRALSLSELAAEVAFTPSGTGAGAAASTTGLRASWPLPDATATTDWSGTSFTPTIVGAATSTEEPTIPAGSSSIAPLAYYSYNQQ